MLDFILGLPKLYIQIGLSLIFVVPVYSLFAAKLGKSNWRYVLIGVPMFLSQLLGDYGLPYLRQFTPSGACQLIDANISSQRPSELQAHSTPDSKVNSLVADCAQRQMTVDMSLTMKFDATYAAAWPIAAKMYQAKLCSAPLMKTFATNYGRVIFAVHFGDGQSREYSVSCDNYDPANVPPTPTATG